MKKVVVCLIVLGVFCIETAFGIDVTFPDSILESDIRDKLGITTPTPITDVDMETIESFSAIHSSTIGISDISGLEFARNLSTLGLNNNQVSDISAVSGLTNLNGLFLNNNQISNISAVSGLMNLEYLACRDNQISDISAVSGLTNMKQLYLSNNQISDISAVSGLTNPEYLNFGENNISNISAVSNLTNLGGLNLNNNQVSDISAVSRLTKMKYLYIENNQIETMDFSGANLPRLAGFDIGGNPLKNVLLTDATLRQKSFDTLMNGGYYTGIADISGVLTLDLSGVDFWDISDMSSMYTMDDLETLLLAEATNLGGSQVSLLTGELNSLNWLDVSGLWYSFDITYQNSLNLWDAIDGNTLIIGSAPEPTNPVPAPGALLLGGMGVSLVGWLRRRRRL